MYRKERYQQNFKENVSTCKHLFIPKHLECSKSAPPPPPQKSEIKNMAKSITSGSCEWDLTWK